MTPITKITLFSADEANQKPEGDLFRSRSENVKLRRPEWPETQFHEKFHEISFFQ